MANAIHNRFHSNILKGNIDFEGDNIRVALMKETYTPAKSDDTWSDISADELDDGNGYTSGGELLENAVVTQGDITDVNADDVDWEDATFTAYYAVLYDDTLTDDDLICSFDFDGGKEVSSGTFRIIFDDAGILTISQA